MLPDAAKTALEQPGARVALIGASNHPSKFGCIILRDLVRKGYEVIPVNPRAGKVCGLEAFERVEEIPGRLGIVNVVVPPVVARSALDGLEPQKVDVVWFQPGAFDRTVEAWARARFDCVVAGPCIMVEARPGGR